MKRIIMAAALVLMTSGTALAHGGFGFRVGIGVPLFYPYYDYPVSYSYYQPPPARVYHRPYAPAAIVERVYVNGYLVEKRIKVYHDRYGHDRRYVPYRGYYR